MSADTNLSGAVIGNRKLTLLGVDFRGQPLPGFGPSGRSRQILIGRKEESWIFQPPKAMADGRTVVGGMLEGDLVPPGIPLYWMRSGWMIAVYRRGKLDRLVHHAEILSLKGDSYRLKGKTSVAGGGYAHLGLSTYRIVPRPDGSIVLSGGRLIDTPWGDEDNLQIPVIGGLMADGLPNKSWGATGRLSFPRLSGHLSDWVTVRDKHLFFGVSRIPKEADYYRFPGPPLKIPRV